MIKGLVLREIEENDLKIILENRNHPDIRKYMFDDSEISWENHKSWFEKLSSDSSKKSFLFEEEGVPKGVVNFVKLDSSRGAEWGFYVFPGAALGTGTKLALSALDKYFLELNGRRLNAEVLSNNPKSFKFHLKMGFIEEGKIRSAHVKDNTLFDIYLFGILRNEWLITREKLIGRQNEN